MMTTPGSHLVETFGIIAHFQEALKNSKLRRRQSEAMHDSKLSHEGNCQRPYRSGARPLPNPDAKSENHELNCCQI